MSLSPTDAYANDRGRQGGSYPAGEADPVVFVDSTGRRALLMRRAAVVFGAAVLAYAGMVGVAFMGGPSLAPSQLTPFDGAGTARDPGGEGARPAGSPSQGPKARQCRKHCGKQCGKHRRQGRPCGRRPFQKSLGSSGGGAAPAKGAAPARSARSAAGGR